MVKRQVEDGDGVDILYTRLRKTVCFFTVTKTDLDIKL